MKHAAKTLFEIDQKSVDPTELRQWLRCLPPATMASSLQPALVTEPKQARPSKNITQVGERFSPAEGLTATELKQKTGVILA